MRLRIPELFDELQITALDVSRLSKGRIGQSTVYRWQQLKGRVKRFDGEAIEDLCEALGLGVEDVMELERPRKRK